MKTFGASRAFFHVYTVPCTQPGSFGYCCIWRPTVALRCANILLQVLILASHHRIYVASYEMFASDFMGVLHQKALMPSPRNEIMLFTDTFPEVGEAEALIWAHDLLYKIVFLFLPCLGGEKKKAEPYLLSDAIFMPLDQRLAGHQFDACN